MIKNILSYLSFFSLCICIVCCKDDVLPKPKAYLNLEYPNPRYENFDKACGYTFDFNTVGQVKDKGSCNYYIEYPKLKATVYLNYRPVQNNIETLLRDAQKLTYEHVIKADNITEQPYTNPESKKYGMFYEVGGNAASQSQFYVTDSTKHFLMGSIYFYAKPNFDSILPAAHYIKNDLRVLMESLKWK